MKSQNILMNSKKGLMLLAFTAIMTSSFFTACNKDDNNAQPTTSAVEEEEIVEAITQSVVPESEGIVMQVSEAYDLAITAANSNYCGITFDSSISKTNQSGATVTYNYALGWEWMLQCEGNNIPNYLDVIFNLTGSYDAPRISSNDKAAGTFSISGLAPAATQYVYSQTYKREGTQQSKVRNKNSFSSTIEINTTNLTINKASGKIVSGTAAVSVSGAASNGNSFSYGGTLTFLGNNNASLVLNNGNTYSISW